MIRWMAFYLWLAISISLAGWALSEFIFGATSSKRLVLRILCALVWPIAMLSQSGRDFLLKIEVEEK